MITTVIIVNNENEIDLLWKSKLETKTIII